MSGWGGNGLDPNSSDAFVAKFVDWPALPGDFDGDGWCDGADFLMWQRGESPDPLSATDLANWQTNFGRAEAALAQRATVPEPTAALLLIVGWMSLCALHKARGLCVPNDGRKERSV